MDPEPSSARTSASPRDHRRARLVPGGPMLIEGPVELAAPSGEVVRSERFMVAVCLCRRSARYPLCDGSHRRVGRRRG